MSPATAGHDLTSALTRRKSVGYNRDHVVSSSERSSHAPLAARSGNGSPSATDDGHAVAEEPPAFRAAKRLRIVPRIAVVLPKMPSGHPDA